MVNEFDRPIFSWHIGRLACGWCKRARRSTDPDFPFQVQPGDLRVPRRFDHRWPRVVSVAMILDQESAAPNNIPERFRIGPQIGERKLLFHVLH